MVCGTTYRGRAASQEKTESREDRLMRIVKTGDPCPLCGRPVTAEDRETLDQLTAIAQMLDRFGIDIAAGAAEKGEEYE